MHRTQDTSIEALQKSDALQHTARCKIVNALSCGETHTCEELGQIIGSPHATTSSAISALRDKGELIDSGIKGKTRSGRMAICWRLTTKGDRQPIIKNGWRCWAGSPVPQGVPFLIRDHQSVYNGGTFMLNDEDRLVNVLEAKWYDGQWHCTGSITGRTIETPLAWRPLPTA